VSEKELGEALLRLDAATLAGVPDQRQQVWRILEADRRRVRWLTGLSVGVWLLAGALVLGGLTSYAFTFPAQARFLRQIEEGKVTMKERDEIQRVLLMSFQKGTFLIALSVKVMAAAALLTVFLILASQRATLRQVNSSLAEVGEQLKLLRQQLAGPAGAG
jgi:hypothetical protein